MRYSKKYRILCSIFLKEVQFWEFKGDMDDQLKPARYRFLLREELALEEKLLKIRRGYIDFAKKIDVNEL